MTHKICLSAAALLALLLALPAPALAYDGATPDQPNRLSAGLSHTAYVDEHGTLWTWGSNQEGQLGVSRHGPAGQRHTPGEGGRAGHADGGRRGGARGHPLSEGHGSGAAGAVGAVGGSAGRCRCGDAAALTGSLERGAGCEADKGSSLAQFRSKFPPLSLLTNPRQSAILYAVKNLIPSCDEGNMPPWISHAESGRSVQGRGEWGGVSPRSVRYLSGRCWTPIRVVPRRNLWSSSL